MSQTPPAKPNLPRPGDTMSSKDLPASAPKPSASRTAPEHIPEVFGRYRILKKLGEGGMGAVYLARDTQLDRQVALKVPTFGARASAHQLERFFREAKAAAAFDHPNLCPVYDAGTIDGTHYLTMPFIEGKPLADFIKPDKRLSQQQVVKVVRKIALAVAEAHKRGVIHRDLKPANIMMNQRGEPVVMDFGLARIDTGEAARLTGAGAILGTPSYMAPEQVKGEQDQVGAATDIYALGVILYEMLTCRRPFEGPTTAVLARILIEPPPPLASLRPDVAPALAAACHQAMAKSPAERFASMEKFAKALADCLGTAGVNAESAGSHPGSVAPAQLQAPGIGTAATAPAAPPRPPTGGRRRKWLVAALSATVVLLLALGALFLFRPDTRQGAIRLDFDPDLHDVSIEVRIAEVGVEREEDYTPVARDNPIWLPSGKYRLTARAAKLSGAIRAKDLDEFTEEFTIRPATVERLKVRLPMKPTAALVPNQPPVQIPAHVKPGPGNWAPGPAEDVLAGLIPRPATLPGIRRWQAETVVFRGEITALAWQPGGNLLACGTSLGDIRLYEDRSMRLVRLLLGHTESVTSVAWSRDGKRLASTSRDRTVRIWQADGTPGPVLRRHSAATWAVAWDLEGKRLASASEDSSVRLWDADGTPGLLLPHGGPASAVSWASDGQWLASAGGGGTIRLWKPDGTPGPVFAHGTDGGWNGRPVAWQPDGKWLASAGRDNVVRLWDANGKPGPVLKGHSSLITSLAWSRDGKRLASGSFDRSVRLWDPDGTEGPVLRTEFEVTAVALNGDGKRLATSWVRTLHLGDADGGTKQFLRATGEVNSVAWTPDGKRLAVANSTAARLWGADAAPMRAPWPDRDSCFSVAWRPDGKRLAFGSMVQLQLWRMDGQPGTEELPQNNSVARVAWRHDGKRVALVIWDGAVRLVNVEGAPVMLPEVVTNGASDVAWSPAGPRLATVHLDGQVRLWEGDGLPGPLLKGHSNRVWCLAWTRDGKRLASGGDDGIRQWEADGTPGRVLKNFDQPVVSVAWSPDGGRLASADQGADRAVRLWGADGTLDATLKRRSGLVRCVAWAPVGDLIAAGGEDGTTVFWDAAAGQPVAVALPLSEGGAVSFTAAGRLIPADARAFESDIVYVVEQVSGRLELLRPSEFLKRVAAAQAE